MQPMNLTQILDEKDQLERDLATALETLKIANDNTEKTQVALDYSLKEFKEVTETMATLLVEVMKAQGDQVLILHLIKAFLGDMTIRRQDLDKWAIEMGVE